MAQMVQNKMDILKKIIICNLLMIDVHLRDIIN
jgi:hypothetical protein